MKFGYILNGENVVIDVFHYKPYCPMKVTGAGSSDAGPSQQEEFEYCVLDSEGKHFLSEVELNKEDEAKVLAHFKKLRGLRQ